MTILDSQLPLVPPCAPLQTNLAAVVSAYNETIDPFGVVLTENESAYFASSEAVLEIAASEEMRLPFCWGTKPGHNPWTTEAMFHVKQVLPDFRNKIKVRADYRLKTAMEGRNVDGSLYSLTQKNVSPRSDRDFLTDARRYGLDPATVKSAVSAGLLSFDSAQMYLSGLQETLRHYDMPKGPRTLFGGRITLASAVRASLFPVRAGLYVWMFNALSDPAVPTYVNPSVAGFALALEIFAVSEFISSRRDRSLDPFIKRSKEAFLNKSFWAEFNLLNVKKHATYVAAGPSGLELDDMHIATRGESFTKESLPAGWGVADTLVGGLEKTIERTAEASSPAATKPVFLFQGPAGDEDKKETHDQ